jgi:hypothetical protein
MVASYVYKVSWSVTAKVKASPVYAGRGHDTMKVDATSQGDAIEIVHLHLQNLFPKGYREGCYNFKAKRLKTR